MASCQVRDPLLPSAAELDVALEAWFSWKLQKTFDNNLSLIKTTVSMYLLKLLYSTACPQDQVKNFVASAGKMDDKEMLKALEKAHVIVTNSLYFKYF